MIMTGILLCLIQGYMDINYIELKVKKKSIKHRKWSKNKIKTTTTYNMYVIITLIQCKFDL